MVSSSHPLASQAGLRVLKAGGNAVDAAVAMSLALGVVSPAFSGLGGGGFMMVRLRGEESLYIDYRETAPSAATSRMFDAGGPRSSNCIGHLAVGVPGT